jgi:hypothetical protein
MRRLAAALVVAVLCAHTAQGQDASKPADTATPRRITVQAIGGFLGFSEAFCENPGGTYDWPAKVAAPGTRGQPDLYPCLTVNPDARWLGGAIGAAALLGGRPDDELKWLVISPNNKAVDENSVFEQHLGRLNADAIGLGAEDLDRLMRGPGGSAKKIVDWIHRNSELRVLASNLAIRKEGGEINETDVAGYELKIDEDKTIGWSAPVVLHFPDHAPASVEVTEGACDAKASAREKIDVSLGKVDGKDVPLKFDEGLRPGTCYWVRPAKDVELHFETDAALTPRPSAWPSLQGVPAVHRGRDHVVVVALVSPGARARARSGAWSWRPDEQKPGRQEVLFQDPVETMRYVIKRATHDKTPPVVVLVSALADVETLKVLEAFPEIRYTVLSPDSSILGRAAGRSDDPKKADPTPRPRFFSGDLGLSAMLDQLYSEATRFVMRPEWVGETLISADADVSTRTVEGQVVWDFKAPHVDVTIVPGAGLSWRENADGSLTYLATLPGERAIELATSRPYSNCKDPKDVACQPFYALWEDSKALAGAAGAGLRQQRHADLAVASEGLIDPDFRLWIADRLAEGNNDTRFLSDFLLQRLMFASPRMVRAFVAGPDLPATLQKIVKADPDNCVSGLGGGCTRPGNDHPERLTVNGRKLDQRLYYSIVMPDALAESLELKHDDDEDLVDMVETTEAYLRRQPLRSERDLNGGYRGYLVFPTLSAGLTRSAPSDDPDGIRANLPVEFAGAEKSRTWSYSVDGDLGLFDWPKWAVRMPMSLTYAQKKQEGFRSYDKDQFSVGGRFDWKFPVLGEVRPFVGFFVDGPLRRHLKRFNASRPVATDGTFDTNEKAKFKTDHLIEPSRYRHVAVGVDLLGLGEVSAGASKFTLTKLGGRWTRGRETRLPVGVAIGGLELSVDDYLSKGAQTLLNEYFADHRETFSSSTRFELLTRKSPLQSRLQGDIVVANTTKAWKRTFKTDLTVQLRQYLYGGAAPSQFALSRTQHYEVKIATPLVGRLTLTPDVSYQRATIAAEKNGKFHYWSLNVTAAFPVAVRWWRGRLLQ